MLQHERRAPVPRNTELDIFGRREPCSMIHLHKSQSKQKENVLALRPRRRILSGTGGSGFYEASTPFCYRPAGTEEFTCK